MPQSQIQLNVGRNVQFSLSSFRNAVQKTNVRSRAVFRQIRQQALTLTPQDLGAVSKRISIQANTVKTPQDRFIDLFA